LLVVNKAFYVVKKYNRKSWQPMLLKWYHYLHPMEDCDAEFIEHKSYEDSNLIFLRWLLAQVN
jgi:hypothetical protein